MKKFYHKVLLAEGYNEDSQMYQNIKRLFDREAKHYSRRKAMQKKLGITFNRMSAFETEDGSSFDFASDENVEESVIHEIELQVLRDCLSEIAPEDRKFLLRIYGGKRGALAELERETGISHNTLNYRRKRLLQTLKEKMQERSF